MSNPRTTITNRPDKGLRRRPNQWLIVWAVLICLAIGLLVAERVFFVTRETNPPEGGNPSSGGGLNTVIPTAPVSEVVDSPREKVLLVDDDGQTLWISPTDGPLLDLRYLPPGCQIIVALRWPDLFKHHEGVKLLDALRPHLMQGLDRLGTGMIGTAANPLSFPRALIGFHIDQEGKWSMSRVAFYYKPIAAAQLKWLQEASWDEEHGEHLGERYGIVGEHAYFFPDPPNADRYVIAPKEVITDIIDLEGEPPPLRRDMARLLAHTDADRIVTILFAPNALFGEGGGIWTGEMARLRDALFWFLGEELSAAAFSMHWDDNFFVELIATPSLDTPPERAARILMERLAEVPGRVEEYLAALKPQPYGREILARFPAMLRAMVAHTRSGVENGQVMLRCYLPAVAGHNLLTGVELTLAETPPASPTVAEATVPSAKPSAMSKSVAERLQQVTSLRFARDTLEAAVDQLARDIGVPIIIRGGDLQAESITKNQSFGIDIENKRAEEILVAILRLANPDKTASGPDDVRQKLVYVISATAAGGAEQIVVTTRAAAAQRGDALPPVFTQKRP